MVDDLDDQGATSAPFHDADQFGTCVLDGVLNRLERHDEHRIARVLVQGPLGEARRVAAMVAGDNARRVYRLT
jgi:hypothetical protein